MFDNEESVVVNESCCGVVGGVEGGGEGGCTPAVKASFVKEFGLTN